ncbi:MAG: type I phosphomannose isomerase catalytic subunit [Acidobacteriaceae bacterium]
MSTLGPFRMAPYFRTRPWGFRDLRPWFDYQTSGEPIGEVWLTGEMCVAETGPHAGHSLKAITADHMQGLLGEAAAAGEFPLLVKILFPREKLSVQVHPDDALAQEYGFPRGKTECWYALEASPDATVALGLVDGTTLDQVRAGIADETLEKYLRWLPVETGDMIYVDAGTVHAIGPGAVLLETQQSSDLTYRMYDYGRGRELHVEKSLQATRLQTRAGKVQPVAEGNHTVLIREHYFVMERWQLAAGEAPAELCAPSRAVQMLFCRDGAVMLGGEGFEEFELKRNQLAVIPAGFASKVSSGGASEIIHIAPCAV